MHHIKKGKSVPLEAWSGIGGSRNLRFPDFMTNAQDRGKVFSLTYLPPLPQEMLLVLIVVKVLCYESEGHWFDPSWCHWNFSLT